jgi:hypothetical protein
MKHGECVIPSTYVATCHLGRRIPLVPLAAALGGRADHSVFSAVFLHCSDTHTVTTTFASGNVVIVGCKTENHAFLAAHIHAYDVSRATNTPCYPINLTICNMVCRTELETSVAKPRFPGETACQAGGNRMHMLHTELQKMPNHVWSTYEPEKFNCIWWYARTFPEMGENSPVIMCAFFDRGRGVLTSGVPGCEEVYNQIIKSIPDCSWNNSFREPTPEELVKEAQDDIYREKLRKLKESRRKATVAPVRSSLPAPSASLPVQEDDSTVRRLLNEQHSRKSKRQKIAFDPHAV